MPVSADPDAAQEASTGEHAVAAAETVSADDVAVTKLLFRAAFAVIAVLLGLGVVALQRDEGTTSPPDAAPLPGSGATRARPTIGPLPGADIPGYEERRKRALATLEGTEPTMAAISLRTYLTEVDARALVRDVEVRGLLVAAPAGTASLTDDVKQWAAQQVEEAKAERENLASMLATTDQADFVADYRQEIARYDALIKRVDPNGAIVFGVLVEGTPAALKRMAKHEQVRLVDITDGGKEANRADIRGLRPEEILRAGEPPNRP